MATYAALLRAVNVAGQGKLPMASLKEALVAAGYDDVQTYLQSGNVVLTTARTKAAQLEGALQATIEKRCGLDTTVLVRTPRQLQKIVDNNPFADEARDHTKVHVLFLASAPTASAREKLEPERFERESFVLAGQELYLHYPEGSGRSKMTLSYFESRLGVAGTARNWRTVESLLELAS